MLARQVREIGIIKTLGGTTRQLVALYAVLVTAVGGASLVGSLPISILGTLGLTRAVATMLNLNLTSRAVPWWVFAVQAAAGLVVPLLFAATPISNAARISVRAAMDSHGVAERFRLGGALAGP